MDTTDRMSPSSWKDHKDKDVFSRLQTRRKQYDQEDRENQPRAHFETRRRTGRRGGGHRGRGDRDGRRSRIDERYFHNESRESVIQKGNGSGSRSNKFGDHCRENGISKSRESEESKLTNRSKTKPTSASDQKHENEGGKPKVLTKFEFESANSDEVRNDLRKEIGKIKKALNLSSDRPSESDKPVGGGFSIKRQATDNLEESKPKKKKKKKKSKSAAAAEKRENGDVLKEKVVPKTKEIIILEKDNSLLRNKLQEILDENMKIKVEFQALKRKWDDADIRIVKLEELARGKDAKLVELEHDSVKMIEKIEAKNRFISNLEEETQITLKKLDDKRKLIRDLDGQILVKDEKYEMIKGEVEEKERHITKLIQVKDELHKSKEVVLKENEEIKKLAKGISNDSDVLVAKLLEKEETISNLKSSKSCEQVSMEFNPSLRDALALKDNIIKDVEEERDQAVLLQNQLESTIRDLKQKLMTDSSVKKEGPEITLSEKCDSSVSLINEKEGENNDIEENSTLTMNNELPDSLFEPLSDELDNSDDDVVKVTSTESLDEIIAESMEENNFIVKKKAALKKTCPFKLNQIPLTNNSSQNPMYRISNKKLLNTEVPCLKVTCGSSKNVLVTLDDFARTFYPKLSTKRVGIILEELDIPFYNISSDQEHVLSQEGAKYSFNPIPLIMCADVERQEEDIKSLFSNF